ncbi:kelch repeat-containing protein [Asanoa sp. WMMD1127]|uniref:Kelch repeat-containing protein n=1 Tax=Asanoa sp. WMMD1127 TaxID=3016107 RepID=UPI002415F609|nr:kelch repeat-containing protein [Asanoa sp. WMMD1127]MDG4825384.1 kelch repeat-containing protein [Asanoa sp. WMMD1127]
MRLSPAVLVPVLLFAAACGGGPKQLPLETAPAPPTAGGGWRSLAPAPTTRTEVVAAAAGSLIYVMGGLVTGGDSVATVEVLDTTTGRWTPGPALPVAVDHAMAATVDGAVHVFGGYTSADRPHTGAYRLTGSSWQPLAPMPAGRAAGTAVAVGSRVHVAGGIGPDGLAREMLVYDAASDTWTTAPGPPTPREHLGGAGIDGIVYTVGGRVRGLDGNLDAFEAFDPRTGEWSTLPALPTARGGLSAAATCTGLVVAIGGEGEETFPEVEAYDVAARAWRALPPLPTPRHGLGVVSVGPTLYTLAGGPHPGLHVADVTEALDVGPC